MIYHSTNAFMTSGLTCQFRLQLSCFALLPVAMGRQPHSVKHLVGKLTKPAWAGGGTRLRELSKQARALVTTELHPPVLPALQREIRQLSEAARDADGLVTKMTNVVEKTLAEGVKEMMGVLLTGELIRYKKKIRKLEAEVKDLSERLMAERDLSERLMAERAAHCDLKLQGEVGR